jgi:Na+-transporting methylmalonyl-CoA/oxaloacetate decarboxylase beta subunit
MRQFTLFTLLYLATGVCLMAIAFQYPEITPNLKATLLVNSGLSYLFAVLSSFGFWRQAARQSQAKLHQQAAWKQNLFAIAPWLIIGLTLVTSFSNLLYYRATEALVQASLGLPIILLSAEQLFIRSQFRQ